MLLNYLILTFNFNSSKSITVLNPGFAVIILEARFRSTPTVP